VESEITQKVISKNTSLDGIPLDFSYKNINELKGRIKIIFRSFKS
jgi:hypothetical protein